MVVSICFFLASVTRSDVIISSKSVLLSNICFRYVRANVIAIQKHKRIHPRLDGVDDNCLGSIVDLKSKQVPSVVSFAFRPSKPLV